MPGVGEEVKIESGGKIKHLWAIALAIIAVMGFVVTFFDVDGKVRALVGERASGEDLVLFAGFLYGMVNACMITITEIAREKYGVGLPIVSPTEKELSNKADRIKFLCMLRAHGNFVEFSGVTVLAYLSVALVAKLPYLAFALMFTYCVGRMIYGFGYATGAANNRLPGFLIAVLSLDAMLGVCLWVPLNKWLA